MGKKESKVEVKWQQLIPIQIFDKIRSGKL